jgi:hypothetical protein
MLSVFEKKLEPEVPPWMKNREKNYPVFFLARRIKTTRATGAPTNDRGAFQVCEVGGCEGIGWLPPTGSPVTVPVFAGSVMVG